jgi:hypothetical protein
MKQCRQADRQQQTKSLQFNNADILVGFCGLFTLWLLSSAAFLSIESIFICYTSTARRRENGKTVNIWI